MLEHLFKLPPVVHLKKIIVYFLQCGSIRLQVASLPAGGRQLQTLTMFMVSLFLFQYLQTFCGH